MQNNRESGFYNPRVFLAFVLYFAGALPSNDLESAILKPASPAGYTAILRGKTGSGIAVVEVYSIQ